jgi:hypothetical protein
MKTVMACLVAAVMAAAACSAPPQRMTRTSIRGHTVYVGQHVDDVERLVGPPDEAITTADVEWSPYATGPLKETFQLRYGTTLLTYGPDGKVQSIKLKSPSK